MGYHRDCTGIALKEHWSRTEIAHWRAAYISVLPAIHFPTFVPYDEEDTAFSC